MKKIIIIMLILFITGVGCKNTKDEIIDKQQDQINKLISTLEEKDEALTKQQEQTDKLINTLQQQVSSTQAVQNVALPVKNLKHEDKPIITVDTPAKVNDCISGAKAERDQRMSALNFVWLECMKKEFNRTNGICDDTKIKIETESKPALYRKFNEWVDECNRGVTPNLKEFAY